MHKFLAFQFLHALLNNVIDCLGLTKRFNFKSNLLNARNKHLFYPPNISKKLYLYPHRKFTIISLILYVIYLIYAFIAV